MFVSGLGSLETMGAGIHLEHEIDDLAELEVSRVGSVPPPAETEPDAFGGQVAQRPIQSLEPDARVVQIVGDARATASPS